MFEQWYYRVKRFKRKLGESLNREKLKNSPRLFAKWSFIIVFGTLVTFFILNFNVFSLYVSTFLNKNNSSQNVQNNSASSPNNTQAPSIKEPVYEVADSLVIPRLNINAPIIFSSWDPALSGKQIEAIIQKDLDNGVVHLQGTANPGFNGNSAIFGHSSNYAWSKGNYNQVFVALNLLQPGDEITVYFQKHKYVYRVSESKTVIPADISVLGQTQNPTLTLVTCWPPGTTLKRMVVSANQISPDPAFAKKNGQTGSYAEIPAGQ